MLMHETRRAVGIPRPTWLALMSWLLSRRSAMAVWKKPVILELHVGQEINAYACASL